jgi:hypothetical protein
MIDASAQQKLFKVGVCFLLIPDGPQKWKANERLVEK